MQGPEEFCRNIDSKLRRSIIMTMAAVFTVACGASLLMYIFTPNDDFLADAFLGSPIGKGDNGCFLMSMAQSDGSKSFSVVSSELTDGVFSAVILGKNNGERDIVLTPDDLCVFFTDVQSCGRPHSCCAVMDGNVVISAGSETLFSISATAPEDFSFEGCKASAIISVGKYGGNLGIMLN